jgi:5-methyltetrahydrofolate--homocysteine methyltransferase
VGWFHPKAVYGFWPCNADGNDVVLYDQSGSNELQRITFPRQREGRKLCIADFFLPLESFRRDVIGLSCVTIGERASVETKKLFDAGEFTRYLYVHGLGVETAEALAEYVHKLMREELGIAGDDAARISDLFHQKYRGSRYSFGYPACPNLEDQVRIFALLKPEETIGVRLTSGFQLEPEQSTSALVVHHPQAKYFVA